MGVRGLQTFVENYCHNVCHTVQIAEMAADHRRRYPGLQPTIVVDGMSLLNRLYTSSLEWVYGGQWVQFCAVLEDFVQRFDQIGVKLVFFFDGTVEPSKRAEWVDRRLRKMRDTTELFEFLKRNKREPPVERFQLPASMGTLVRFVFKCRIGCEVYSTTREADLEIAEYAKIQDKVFAILGQDSDFIIFDTKPYLSASHLDLTQMTTLFYDRQALAYSLSLPVSNLPLFSCIMGNDIIPTEMVKPFHRILCQQAGARNPHFSQVAPLVGALINSKRWNGDISNETELAMVAAIATGDGRNGPLLRSALKSYHLTTNPKRAPSLNEEKHVLCEVAPTLYNIMRNLEYESSELLEDCEGQGLPPAALIYRPVRRRIYSILFAGKPDVVIKEWCAYLGNPMTAPEQVTPLRIAIPRTCKLGELWSGLPQFQRARFEHYLGCLGSTIQLEDLLQVPRHYVALVSILNYLITFNPQLFYPWEVIAFLVQAVSLQSTDIKNLYDLKVPWIEPRAINLAGIFLRGVALVVMLLGACSYPFALGDAMPWNFFDGKLFHYTYIQAAENAHIESLCKTQEEAFEVDYLYSIVTRGTALESKSLLQSRR